MSYSFKNLVFEGGGVKGLAYVGAMEVLAEKGILDNVEKVAGSSAGAIASVLIGLGYDNQRLKQIMTEMNFMEFIDIGSDKGEKNVFLRFFTEFGLVKGDLFCQWVEERIVEAGFDKNLTFSELTKAIDASDDKRRGRKCRYMYLTGTNLQTGVGEIYSNETTPTMRIVDAVRISMAFPVAFTAKPNNEGDLCIDGGLLCNFPVRTFDYDLTLSPYERYVKQNVNDFTLGFRLSEGDIYSLPTASKRKINNMFDYGMAIVNSYLDFQDNRHLEGNDWARTVHIDSLGVGTLQFFITDAQKQALIESGRKGVITYLNWYDSEKARGAK